MRLTPTALGDLERAFLFFPQQQLRGTPAHVGISYEDVWLTASDGVKLHAWYIRGEQGNKGIDDDDESRIAMLMTHGNGGNISVRLDQYAEFVKRFKRIDILSLSYRGYGASEGVPSEDGFAKDAVVAYQWLSNRIKSSARANNTVIVFFGRSMGGAVAAKLATKHSPDALILECAPSSIAHIAKQVTPWRYLPIDHIIINKFDTEAYVRDVTCPVLVMQSESDEIVPYECAGKILAAVSGPKQHYMMKNALHNFADTVDPDGYYDAISSFLKDSTGWV